MIRFVVGVSMAVLLWTGAFLLEGGNPLSLLGLTAFLITFFVPLAGVLAVWSWGTWLRAWGHAFRKSDDAAAVRVSVEIWKFSEFACYLAGALGWLTGAILILGNVEGVDLVRFGQVNAAGLVAPMYGLFFAFVCRLLRTRVESLHP